MLVTFLDSFLRSPVAQYDPLIQPALLRHEVQSTLESHRTTASARFNAARIVAGHDDRVLVIVGPCSIHSPEQALAYAKLLKEKIPTWPDLLIIMRAYLYVHPSPFHLCLVVNNTCTPQRGDSFLLSWEVSFPDIHPFLIRNHALQLAGKASSTTPP